MQMGDYVLSNSQKDRVICPICSPTRKAKNDPTLSIKDFGDRVVWNCWHCNDKGAVRREVSVSVIPPHKEPTSKVVPLREIPTDTLTEDGEQYLQSRGISKATAEKLGIVSGVKYFRKAGQELPAIGFIYNYKDTNYAAKWRSISVKDFTQDGATATLYPSHIITDKDRLIITEGEMDAASFWEAGIEALSIPSGAVAAQTADDSSRLKWMALHDELLAGASDVYLAVDMDDPGSTTANELARRIGKAKCWKVVYPPGCKDANDVLLKHGAQGLEDCITYATRWPIEGIAAVSDYADKVLGLFKTGMPRGLSTGWLSVDEIYTLNPGNLVIVTGIPGHGKSTFLDSLLVNAMKQHDWRIAIASFENPQEIHISKLIAQKVDKPFGTGPTPRMTEQEMLEAMAWVNERVTFLTNDGVMPTVSSLIERFETAIRRYGVKACVVDPFNFIKLPGRDGGFDTEAINEMLSEFKMFALRSEVVFYLVAHPAKPMAGNSDFIPTGYSISGSAHFYNRADFGLTLHRKNNESHLHCWKARFAHQGKLGAAQLFYDPPTGAFHDHNTLPFVQPLTFDDNDIPF